MSELFVYYQIPMDEADGVQAQVGLAQAALTGRWPELQCRLLWQVRTSRPAAADPAGSALITCMETYAAPAGLTPTMLRDIDATMAALPMRRHGERHRELFGRHVPRPCGP